jgi:hypothetical protein
MVVPGAARFSAPCIGASMRRGPLTPGAQRAGTFGLFLLPGGRPRRFAPELEDPAAEVSWEVVVLEEASEVPRALRKLHLKA